MSAEMLPEGVGQDWEAPEAGEPDTEVVDQEVSDAEVKKEKPHIHVEGTGPDSYMDAPRGSWYRNPFFADQAKAAASLAIPNLLIGRGR